MELILIIIITALAYAIILMAMVDILETLPQLTHTRLQDMIAYPLCLFTAIILSGSVLFLLLLYCWHFI